MMRRLGWTTMGNVGKGLLLVIALGLLGPAHAAAEARAAVDDASDADEAAAEELRERLTEREDENRLAEPWSVDLAGHPLMVSGQYEIAVDYLRRDALGDSTDDDDRVQLEQEIETELFYSLGPKLSLFAQFRLGMEKHVDVGTEDRVSDWFVERGETWLYTEDLAESGLSFEAGRLDFEDDRLWWWDEDRDGVRISYETDTFELALAAARELGPNRSDRSFVEPEDERVLRLIGELSWDYRPNHAFEIFALHQDDHSPTQEPGDRVQRDREDDSDARLTWLGARLLGAWASEDRGILGYWLDTGVVRGEEKKLDFEEISSRASVVDDRTRRDVRGWAFDAGATWILPWIAEPRLTVGYARGAGDRKPESGADRSFRQTGLQANEPGFGGVQRFQGYGELLDPELSNLSILTVGAGLSLMGSSSIDLVYHYYRLVEPADSLRDARLDTELTGEHRDLGHGVDLVFAVEEWERFELEMVGSLFRAGRAFGEDRGTWTYGGFLALRIAF